MNLKGRVTERDGKRERISHLLIHSPMATTDRAGPGQEFFVDLSHGCPGPFLGILVGR